MNFTILFLFLFFMLGIIPDYFFQLFEEFTIIDIEIIYDSEDRLKSINQQFSLSESLKLNRVLYENLQNTINIQKLNKKDHYDSLYQEIFSKNSEIYFLNDYEANSSINYFLVLTTKQLSFRYYFDQKYNKYKSNIDFEI